MAGNFWSAAPETKRAYRWVVYINNIHTYMAKSVSKPTVSVSEISHRFINHTFWYPGRVEWDQVSVVLVDPVSPDAAATVMSMIEAAGYAPPLGLQTFWQTMSKASAVSALNGVEIVQIDEDGIPIETWTLHNPWIKDVKFGELSYDNDDLMTVSLTLRYDWAYLTTANAGHPLSMTSAQNKYNEATQFPKGHNK
tara:strand:+ start:281 stop:865 length:585 start_codon:yes stop_codon:yes gene_type:complete